MKIEALLREAEDFKSYLNQENKFSVTLLRKLGCSKPISDPVNADLRVLGLGTASGLYFVVGSDGEVLYIGKATKDNLHAELWGKLRTPVGEQLPYEYPNTYWSRMELPKTVAQELFSGSVCVSALQVEPSWVTSLLEVYLQTCFYSKSGRLPTLNSQIG